MTRNVPKIAVQMEITSEPEMAPIEYLQVRRARERNPTPASTRASAPKRLRSRTQRRPDVRKLDRPRSPKKRIPLVMIPSGGRTKRPPATIRSHQDRTSFRRFVDRKSTRLNSSHLVISYAVFCLKKKKKVPQDDTGS